MIPFPSNVAVLSITVMFGQYNYNCSNDAFGNWDNSYLIWRVTQMTVLHSYHQLLHVLPQGACHLWSIFCHPPFYGPPSSLEQLPITWQLSVIVAPSIFIYLSGMTSLSIFKFLESSAAWCVHLGHIICPWFQDVHMEDAQNMVHK